MVMDLGGHGNRDPIHLYCSYEGERGRYVALSHRWIDLGNFCTYQCNVDGRYQEMSINNLPKKFQDAITVTQRLGIQFLWIDSIFIIRRHDGCRECGGSSDWDIERDKMEDCFGSAYLTIAATSITHRQDDEGVLVRQSYAHWAKDQNAAGPYSDSVAIDDIQRDVEGADLNNRGWVLQERALSHRTIHFTLTQAY
ncbi:hypothetical protein B0O99DRAFT_694025 [Bisporella sp. PMI_857]|nr:hypothetical protein B0O99DRAFT_694025 [Bisporella sp. PMI_857]